MHYQWMEIPDRTVSVLSTLAMMRQGAQILRPDPRALAPEPQGCRPRRFGEASF